MKNLLTSFDKKITLNGLNKVVSHKIYATNIYFKYIGKFASTGIDTIDLVIDGVEYLNVCTRVNTISEKTARYSEYYEFADGMIIRNSHKKMIEYFLNTLK